MQNPSAITHGACLPGWVSLHTPLALEQDKMVSPSKLLYACMHSCEHPLTSLTTLTFKFTLDHHCREDM